MSALKLRDSVENIDNKTDVSIEFFLILRKNGRASNKKYRSNIPPSENAAYFFLQGRHSEKNREHFYKPKIRLIDRTIIKIIEKIVTFIIQYRRTILIPNDQYARVYISISFMRS